MIDVLKKYDELFAQNHSCGDESATNVFELNHRGSGLILSAPHATRSFVCKKEKIADLYTGALVRFLGEENDVSTLVRVKYVPYKEMISDYIAEQQLLNHYFLDVHGFSKEIDYDICLGIGDYDADTYPKLAEIVAIAKKFDLRVIVNHPDYTGRHGLTGRYHKAYGKPNVIQIELQRNLRDFYSHPELVLNKTIPFFREVIRCYK